MNFKKGQMVMTPIHYAPVKVLKSKGNFITVKVLGMVLEISADTVKLASS